MIVRFREAGQRRHQPPASNDGAQQRLSLCGFLGAGQPVAGQSLVGIQAPVGLGCAGPVGLSLGALATRLAGIGLQLVGAVEPGQVFRGDQAGADAEEVDRGVLCGEGSELVLVQAAARDDPGLGEASRIQDRPDLAGVLREIVG